MVDEKEPETDISDFDGDKLINTIRRIRARIRSPEYKNCNYATKYNNLADECDEINNFEKRYPTLFKMVIDDADLRILSIYVYYLTAVKAGKISMEDAEVKLGILLKEKYLDPIFHS